MGRYINKDSKGNVLPTKGKIKALIADGAEEIKFIVFQENLVVITDNGPFEAAAFAYNQNEFNEFNRFDGRTKTWLVYKHANALAK